MAVKQEAVLPARSETAAAERARVETAMVAVSRACHASAMEHRSCNRSTHAFSMNTSSSPWRCATDTSSRIDQVEMELEAMPVVVATPEGHQVATAARAAAWA